MRVLWTIYVVFAVCMGIEGFLSWTHAQGAEQQLAAAGFALAGVVVPYLALKGIQEMIRPGGTGGA